MNNYFAIAFGCVYLTLAVGVAKTTHYCMGREKHSTHFSYETESCFCSTLSGGTFGCCDNKSRLLKVDDDHSASAQLSAPVAQFNLIEEFEFLVFDFNVSKEEKDIQQEPIRPPPSKVYIRHCSLIFYDNDDLVG